MTASQLILLRALTPDWPDTPQERAYDCMAEEWIHETGSQEGVSESSTGESPPRSTGFADDLLHGTAKALRPGRVDETETGARPARSRRLRISNSEG